MADLGIRSRVLVKDVMTSPVIMIQEDDHAVKAAQLMDKHNIGCVIVGTKEGKPIGVITERDLVARVVAEDARPSEVMAKDIMSAPLITIDSDKTLEESARIMSQLNIRRLGVMHKGNLIGIISSKDILAVTPELIEIIREKARIEGENLAEETRVSPPSAGYCDNCGIWSDSLREVEGIFLCEDCRIEQESSEY